jgi:hypothetical protein
MLEGKQTEAKADALSKLLEECKLRQTTCEWKGQLC